MGRPWFAFYPADYARDTGHLSFVEDAAYRRLMDHYYSSATPLPTDVERLLRVCRAHVEAEAAAVRFVLAEFFTLEADGYHHARIDAELKKAAEKIKKCSEAGQRSAQSRQQTANENSTDVITNVPTERATERQPSHPQSQRKKEEGFRSFVVGKGGEKPEMTDDNKIALFQKWLATSIGRDGWKIVGTAADPNSDGYDEAVRFCRDHARKHGKGWPHKWPTPHIPPTSQLGAVHQ